MNIWDCCYNAVARGVMRDVVATDNVVGYNFVLPDFSWRSDYKLDDCATDAAGASRCVRNRSIAGAITRETEAAERGAWQNKVRRAGVKIGPR
jgi:hypothetical protein